MKLCEIIKKETISQNLKITVPINCMMKLVGQLYHQRNLKCINKRNLWRYIGRLVLFTYNM